MYMRVYVTNNGGMVKLEHEDEGENAEKSSSGGTENETRETPAEDEGDLLTPEERKARTAEFAEYQKQQFAIRISNYEKADAAVLTLASLFLGLSITFLKDIVKPSEAVGLGLVVASWVLFCASIASVLGSFYTGRQSAEDAEAQAYKFYIENDADALSDWEKKIPSIKRTKLLNTAGGVCLLLAILCWVVFASLNLFSPTETKENDTQMRKDQTKGVPASTPRPTIAPAQPATPKPAPSPSTAKPGKS